MSSPTAAGYAAWRAFVRAGKRPMPNAANDSIASNKTRPRIRSIGSSSGRNRGNGSIAVSATTGSHTASLDADWHQLLEEPCSSTRAAALLALRSRQLSERRQNDSLADLSPWSAPPLPPLLREPLNPTYFSSHIPPISLAECHEPSSASSSNPSTLPAEVVTPRTTAIDFTIPTKIKAELSKLLLQQPEEHAVLRLLRKLHRTSPRTSLYAITFRLLFHMLKEEPDPNTWSQHYTSLVLFLYQHSLTLDKTSQARPCTGVIVRLYRKLLESGQAQHGRLAPSLLLDPRLKTSTVRWMLRQATLPLRQRCIHLHGRGSVTGDRRQARHCLDLWRDAAEQLVISGKLVFGEQQSSSAAAEADDSTGLGHLLRLLAEYGNTASVVRLATVLYHAAGCLDPMPPNDVARQELLIRMQTHPWHDSQDVIAAVPVKATPPKSFLAEGTADSLIRTLTAKGQHSQAAFIFALIPLQYRTAASFEVLLSRYGEASLIGDKMRGDITRDESEETRWRHAPPSMAYQHQLWSEAQQYLLLQPASTRDECALRFFKARLASHAFHASPQMVLHDLRSMKRCDLLPRRGKKQQTRLSSLPFSAQISAVRAFLRAERPDTAQSLADKLLSDHRSSAVRTSLAKPAPPGMLATLLLNTLLHSHLPLQSSFPAVRDRSSPSGPSGRADQPQYLSTSDLRRFLSQLELLTTRLNAKMNVVTRNIIMTALFRWQEGAVSRRDRQFMRELAGKMKVFVEEQDHDLDPTSSETVNATPAAGKDEKQSRASPLSFMSSIFDHTSSPQDIRSSEMTNGSSRSLTAYRQNEGAILQELARALHRRGMKQEGRMVVGFLKEEEARLKGRRG